MSHDKLDNLIIDELLLWSDISHLYFFDASRDCTTGSGTEPMTSDSSAPTAELSNESLSTEAQQQERQAFTLDQQASASCHIRSGQQPVRLLSIRCTGSPPFDPGSPEPPYKRWWPRKS